MKTTSTLTVRNIVSTATAFIPAATAETFPAFFPVYA